VYCVSWLQPASRLAQINTTAPVNRFVILPSLRKHYFVSMTAKRHGSNQTTLISLNAEEGEEKEKQPEADFRLKRLSWRGGLTN